VAPRAPRRRRVEDPYPRFYHPTKSAGPCGEHFVRVVENPGDLKGFCGWHDGCTLTRSLVNGAASRCRGRPAGLIWAWMDAADTCSTKAEHAALLSTLKDDLGRRVAARNALSALPGSELLLRGEAQPEDPARPEPIRVR
jgi:hypothetical protein